MKIIEAMKKIKGLYVKAEDLRGKIAEASADHDYETPKYPDQAAQVREWLQAHSDILREIASLQLAVQRTNLATKCPITLGDNTITKPISYWLLRRGPKDKKGLASLELSAWSKLTDRGLKEGQLQLATGAQPMNVKIRRYYDPLVRDKNVEMYKDEANTIDAALEVANATVELIEE